MHVSSRSGEARPNCYRLCLLLREPLTSEHLGLLIDCATVQDAWWLCMVTKKSCTKLKMSEFDDTFSDERDTPEVRFSSVDLHVL